MTQTFDIIVVGASFAGSAFVRNLPKDKRHKVLIVDAKSEIGATVESTGLITSHTRSLFSGFFDIDRHITNRITTLCVVTTDFNEHFISVTPEPWIFQTDTRNLVKALNENYGEHVTFWPGTVYADANRDDYDTTGLVNVTLLRNGQRIEAKTRFLIGADGGGSLVASTNGLDQNKKFLFGVENVHFGHVHLGPSPEQTIYHFWFGEFSLGYGGWLSSTVIDGKPAFRIGLAKQLDANRNATQLLKHFTDTLASKGIITFSDKDQETETPASKMLYGHKIPIGGILKRIHTPGVLLLGDAAGFCGAFAADGIKGALISGIEGAMLVDEYLSSKTPKQEIFKAFHPRMNAHHKVIRYYQKQLLYRFVWERMKSDRTFRAMYDVIKNERESFLLQFCDSKDKGRSLVWIMLKLHNIPGLFRYAWFLFLDLFKRQNRI
jgi:flavin-dependent dehydrogenase